MEKLVRSTVSQIGSVVLGKEHQVRLALCCLLARGHLLIEDLPGMGKTTLAHALAKVLGLQFNRVQFTSDLLPSDILGVSVFDKNAGAFTFHPGPVFTQVLLADEINRTTPKTQSALLEAMAESQVTVEGETRPLPQPFFVIATQNPVTQSGTFALPESQLDRFLMRIEIGYPDPVAERSMLLGGDSRSAADRLPVTIKPNELSEIQNHVDHIKVSEALLDYVQRLIAYSRNAEQFSYGLSPRGALALIRCARTWALMAGRKYVVPEDVQAILPSVVGHRLSGAADFAGDGSALANRLLASVPVM